MKKYRQWLAEQDHMTESPDGDYYLVTEVDTALAEKDKEIERLKGEVKSWRLAAAAGTDAHKEWCKQIAALQKENKELLEQGTAIMDDQGAKNILLKEQIAALTAGMDHWKTLKEHQTEAAAGWHNETLALTAERDNEKSAHWTATYELDMAREENRRLREALERIAAYGADGICPYGCDTPSIAQAAIEKEV